MPKGVSVERLYQRALNQESKDPQAPWPEAVWRAARAAGGRDGEVTAEEVKQYLRAKLNELRWPTGRPSEAEAQLNALPAMIAAELKDPTVPRRDRPWSVASLYEYAKLAFPEELARAFLRLAKGVDGFIGDGDRKLSLEEIEQAHARTANEAQMLEVLRVVVGSVREPPSPSLRSRFEAKLRGATPVHAPLPSTQHKPSPFEGVLEWAALFLGGPR